MTVSAPEAPYWNERPPAPVGVPQYPQRPRVHRPGPYDSSQVPLPPPPSTIPQYSPTEVEMEEITPDAILPEEMHQRNLNVPPTQAGACTLHKRVQCHDCHEHRSVPHGDTLKTPNGQQNSNSPSETSDTTFPPHPSSTTHASTQSQFSTNDDAHNLCSIHNKMRTANCLEEDGKGGRKCIKEQECRTKVTNGSDPNTSEKGLCSDHKCYREWEALLHDGMGGFMCSEDSPCPQQEQRANNFTEIVPMNPKSAPPAPTNTIVPYTPNPCPIQSSHHGTQRMHPQHPLYHHGPHHAGGPPPGHHHHHGPPGHPPHGGPPPGHHHHHGPPGHPVHGGPPPHHGHPLPGPIIAHGGHVHPSHPLPHHHHPGIHPSGIPYGMEQPRCAAHGKVSGPDGLGLVKEEIKDDHQSHALALTHPPHGHPHHHHHPHVMPPHGHPHHHHGPHAHVSPYPPPLPHYPHPGHPVHYPPHQPHPHHPGPYNAIVPHHPHGRPVFHPHHHEPHGHVMPLPLSHAPESSGREYRQNLMLCKTHNKLRKQTCLVEDEHGNLTCSKDATCRVRHEHTIGAGALAQQQHQQQSIEGDISQMYEDIKSDIADLTKKMTPIPYSAQIHSRTHLPFQRTKLTGSSKKRQKQSREKQNNKENNQQNMELNVDAKDL